MQPRRHLPVLLAVLASAPLSACVGGGAPRVDKAACLLASQRRMIQTDIYFGRDIPAGGVVTDAAWADFVAQVVAPRFADGFTVFDATGQWLSPNSHQVVREATKVVRIVVPAGDDVPAKIQAIADAYKSRFRQDSVGIVAAATCAAF